jgi:putative polyhydroxyalkanoate system protein
LAQIQIHREHALGLERAREIAWQWAGEVEQKFGMTCTVIEGEYSDTVEFTRSGVSGRLIVAADHFDLDARLGFLLGAFSRTIETEILKNLDDLLAKAPPARAAAKAAAKAGVKGGVKGGVEGAAGPSDAKSGANGAARRRGKAA